MQESSPIGKLIRLRRREANLTQTMLAEKAKVDLSYLVKIETGKKSSSMKLLFRLGEVLGIDEKELFDFSLSDTLYFSRRERMKQDYLNFSVQLQGALMELAPIISKTKGGVKFVDLSYQAQKTLWEIGKILSKYL
jgi:transcriptional regulator with XRE-family HTH domain